MIYTSFSKSRNINIYNKLCGCLNISQIYINVIWPLIVFVHSFKKVTKSVPSTTISLSANSWKVFSYSLSHISSIDGSRYTRCILENETAEGIGSFRNLAKRDIFW